jgi:hypothetical protein
MLSFTEMQTQFQDDVNDTSANALTYAKRVINVGREILESSLNVKSLKDSRTGNTSSSTNIVSLPENFIRLIKFYVTVGTVKYPATPVYDEDLWRILTSRTTAPKSNILEKVFVQRNTLELYPYPSSANVWTMEYEGFTKPLVNDDYTTGTITTLANGGTSVVGSSTVWTAQMVGRYFKITADGQWYEISAFTDATHITLKTAYQGAAIAAGSSAYVIGEMLRTPGPTHIIPVLYANWRWFKGVKKDRTTAREWKQDYMEMLNWAKSTFGQQHASNYIPSQRYEKSRSRLNPNYFPRNIT